MREKLRKLLLQQIFKNSSSTLIFKMEEFFEDNYTNVDNASVTDTSSPEYYIFYIHLNKS